MRPYDIIRLNAGVLEILDQRSLPQDVRYVSVPDAYVMADLIKSLAVRGAPLIGIAAAYAYAQEASRGHDLAAAYNVLVNSRPTAVNLKWALDQMQDNPTWAQAMMLHEEEIRRCDQMSKYASDLVEEGRDNVQVLTHCNAGALATGGMGSGLGAVIELYRQGKLFHVWVDETRPLLQGSRLTAWELSQEGIHFDLITDSMAASLMALRDVDLIFVGADRIAPNGDTANKIGTYSLAVLANHHNVPFYVVAPTSTIDPNIESGDGIPIEYRDKNEISDQFNAYNPAFDVTPAELITAIVTEHGVHYPPYPESLPKEGSVVHST